MKTRAESSGEILKVLLVGNNPLDMSKTLDKIHEVRGRRIVTEIAFDSRSTSERLIKFNPDFILIDDNIGRGEMALTMDSLSRSGKTRNTPVTILKNSNYQEASTSNSVLDYILKQNFSAESLYNAIRNSLKLKRTQELLYRAYRQRKGQLLGRLAFS